MNGVPEEYTPLSFIDLVIKDETDMQIFLKFLIIKLNTFDSNKNSMNFLRDQRLVHLNASKHDIMRRVYFGYTIMKIRMKVSFEACLK